MRLTDNLRIAHNGCHCSYLEWSSKAHVKGVGDFEPRHPGQNPAYICCTVLHAGRTNQV